MILKSVILLSLFCGFVTSQSTARAAEVILGPGEINEDIKQGSCVIRNVSCDGMKCAECTWCFTLGVTQGRHACQFNFVDNSEESCSTRPQWAEFLILKTGIQSGYLSVSEYVNKNKLCNDGNDTFGEYYIRYGCSFCRPSTNEGRFKMMTSQPRVFYYPNYDYSKNSTELPAVDDIIWIKFRRYRYPQPDPSCGTCPQGFVKHHCLCYALFQLPNVTTWYDADYHCDDLGADLVSILDGEEMTDLKHFMRSVWWDYGYKRKKDGGEWFFIGSEDVFSEKGNDRNRYWTDGQTMTYTEWYHTTEASFLNLEDVGQAIIKTRKQPTSMQASTCTIMQFGNHRLFEKTSWFKIPCRYPVPNALFICKTKASPVGKLTAMVLQGLMEADTNGTVYVACEVGWTYRNGLCFLMYTSLAPLNDSDCDEMSSKYLNGICQELTSSLADVSTERGLESVKYLLRVWNYFYEYGPVLVSNGTAHIFNLSHHSDIYRDANEEKRMMFTESKERYYTNTTTSYPLRNVICQRAPAVSRVVCNNNQWRCGDGMCISIDYVCNRFPDCGDGSDENDCDHETFKLFPCKNGSEIPYSWRCDFIRHCKDGSDEMDCYHHACRKRNEFRCVNGQCIPSTKVCDGVKDCVDGSDERRIVCRKTCPGFSCYSGDCIPSDFKNDIYGDCTGIIMEDEFLPVTDVWRGRFVPYKYLSQIYGVTADTVYNFEPYCKHSDETRCTFIFSKCFKRSRACVLENNQYGVMKSCRDGSHLKECQEYECPGMFKCSKSYCIPMNKRCDHVIDCPYGQDEQGCQGYSCPGYFRCNGRTSCLEPSQVCDGHVDCFESHDDEKNCVAEKCPPSCICRGDVVGCPNAGLGTLLKALPSSLRFLNATGNNLKLVPDSLVKFRYLAWLDLSHNKISAIPERTFVHCNNLLHLNLAYNNFTTIEAETFKGLVNLQELILTGNKIQKIASMSFKQMPITVLDLSQQEIKEIPDKVFNGMPKITDLLLNNNQIEKISIFAFDGLGNLSSLNLKHNRLGRLRKVVFKHLQLTYLETDKFAFCCAAYDKSVKAVKKGGLCTPQPDDFSSCADLLSNYTLMVAIWVLGLLALFGNAFVLIWRFIHRRDGVAVENLLVTNLSIADFLMGVYLVIVGAADISYRGVFVSYAEEWQASVLCRLAGVLSFVSSEISVLMLVFITADRVIAIVYAFKVEKVSIKQVAVVIPIMWITVVTFALIPLRNKGIFYKFYGGNAVCLPFSLGRGPDTYGLIFLTINLVAFLLIAVGYLSIYHTIRGSRKRFKRFGNAQAKDRNTEMIFVKKMTMVIVSDFCCWIPIVVLKYLAIAGVKIPQELAVWTAVFILPVNSSINPFLYTVATIKTWRGTRKDKSVTNSTSVGYSTDSVRTVVTDMELKVPK